MTKPRGRTDAPRKREKVRHPSLLQRAVPRRIRTYLRKNLLALLPVVIGVPSLVIYYLGYIEPDIRYVSSLPSEALTILERKVDANANFVYYFRMKPKFKNLSIKKGFIDKAELVPLSIATLPETRITSINKAPIGWREEKVVEIMFIMTLPTDAINNINKTKDVSADIVLAAFDNTGKKIDRFPDGKFARIQFKLTDSIRFDLKEGNVLGPSR